jgi:hypothetical protein
MRGGPRPRVSRLAAIGGACAIAVAAAQLRTWPGVAEIGDVVVPVVAAASRLVVGAGAAPVETVARAAEQPTPAPRLSPRLLAPTTANAGSSKSARPSEPSPPAAVLLEEIPTATMADITHAAYHDIEPSRDSARATVRSPEPAQPEDAAQRGPFWRRFEKAGVGIGGAFANFGQSVARRF